MERLKKERKPVRAHVTRLINECERILEQAPPDQDALLTHLELLKDVFTHLTVLDEKVKEQLTLKLNVKSKILSSHVRCQPEGEARMQFPMTAVELTIPAKPPPQPGDIVLVGEDRKNRFHWPLGLIIELIPRRDGKQRVAKVKTSHGILLRPIQRLFPLEISAGEELAARMKTIPTSRLKPDSTPEVKAFSGESDHAISKSGRILKRPASN
ncbi:unnamed protein product [Orchesella dallaii]|uniref:DUF5641 domain-containing protein n=1 Tax=Orchesella dallaii TaxID=48710 RepID=A0ABP1RE72_9HEXA